ncbi:hypothetical protein LMH87_000554 [Akanthomyces muscarius]|uniref:Uncharacterized protein n=1 Tax=Akanthomyces muscarius TaxID=2231603 RepID=A0A9W8UNZ2_AKAMU|nr:hypothetical protein LMH87_000554 [Akanthomyces muscarius]KAJ4155300.1 hypothetical protein LMH87_000554 [Akanthomyces muscarius]
MPLDKSGALLVVAGDQNTWMEAYSSMRRGGKITRHMKLPKTPSKALKFLAYSAGAPRGTTSIRKSSKIRPEDMWWDGAHVKYQESDPRILWVGSKTPEVEDDDDEDDDDGNDDYGNYCGCGHPPGSNYCGGCATPYLGWESHSPDYWHDSYGHNYDYYGHYNAPQVPCQEMSYSMPAGYPLPEDKRGRRFTRMASPPPRGDDPDEHFVWQAGDYGPVRYSAPRMLPLCEDPWKRPSGVDRYRCG